MYDVSQYGTTGAERALFPCIHLNYLSKTYIGPIYITGDPSTGVLIDGGDGQLVLNGVRSEGRNANSPTAGTCIRINDNGIIQVAVGTVLIDGAWYSRASTVAESVPFLNVTGGNMRIKNTMPMGTWTGKPIAHQSAAGLIAADDSSTVTTG